MAGPSVAALGVGGNQLGMGIGGNAVRGLTGTGVDRFLEGSSRRFDVVGSLGSGAASLGGGVLPTGGADLGIGGMGMGALGGGYGGGNNAFNSGQLGPQSNLIGGAGGPGGLASSGRDFDSLSAAITGGYNSQVSDREFRRGVAGSVGGMVGAGGAGGMNSNAPSIKGQMSESIIVKNLPNVSWQQLKDKFSEAGDVKFAEVNSSKDMGLVQFGSTWEANRAINLFDRTRWDGQSLDIRFY